MSRYCIIPARAGSKRLPGKNKANILGKPMYRYAIENCIQADIFDHIIVTTDDQDIIAELSDCQSIYLHVRSNYSGDSDTLLDLTFHVLKDYQPQDDDWIYLILPTYPLRETQLLVEAVQKEGDASSICATSLSPFDPRQTLVRKNTDSHASPMIESAISRRKEPDTVYESVNGSLFAVIYAKLTAQHSFFVPPIATVETPWWKSIDINTKHDLYVVHKLCQ